MLRCWTAIPLILSCVASASAQDKAPTGLRDDSIATLFPAADPFGHRAFLASRGITYELNYVFDAIGNTSGGMRRGTVYSGRTEAVVEGDLEKLVNWSGANFRVNAFHIHGSALSRSYIGNLAPVSNIEAFPAVRLFEAWVQQKLGPFSLRVGQLGSDSETAASSTAGQFNNGTFGWPAINAGNLPSGGPAYPIATLGATLKFDFQDAGLKVPAGLLFGVFNGDTARPGLEDPQRRNRNGLDFRFRHGALYAVEARYDIDKNGPYAGTYKVGAWYHSWNKFLDKRWGTDGLSLADPNSNGEALRHRGNAGVYGIIDQTLIPADKDGFGQVSGFVRAFFTPHQDRNLISSQIDGGLVIKGLFGRANDAAGIAAAYMKVAKSNRALDRDAISFGSDGFVRSSEIAIEANYLFEVRRGFTLQPSIQYIIRPGGSVQNPLSATPATIKNATVLGVRGVVKY